MYNNHTCPRCATPISFDRMMGNVVVCSCGWTGDKSVFDGPKRNFHTKKITFLAVAGLIAFGGFQAKKWGKHLPERAWYSAKSSLRMTTAKDEARMAFVCKQMERHKCAAQAYTKALAKAPKAYDIAGALAVELTKVGEYDRAILTFQNFYSHEDGNDVHKQHYARALALRDYTDDATEWYYKALQDNSKNFEAAKELINHLSKHENHVEALSVIGHYNTLYPKTIEDWAQLTQDVKNKYASYTDTYDVKEIKISGINKFLHAPVRFSNSMETQLFLVDPESEYLTVDLQRIQEMGITYKDLGTKEIMATNGKYLKGNQIVLSELQVGPFKLKDVKAMACERCAFLLGKDVMKRLNFSAQNNKGINYITLKQ